MLKLHHAMLVLAILLAMLGDSWGQSQRPPPTGGQQSSPPQAQTQSSQRESYPTGSEQFPFSVRNIKSKEEAAEDEQDRKDKAFNDHITIFLAAAVAIGTLLQCKALWTIIDTSRRQVRAYITVHSVDFTIQTDPDGRYIHHLKAINTGQTPARGLQVDSVTQILPHPVAATYDFPPAEEDGRKSMWTVGAGRDVAFNAEADRHYSVGEIRDFSREKAPNRLYSYGTITYRDVFGESHWTKFCLFFDSYRHEDGSIRTRVSASEHHNDET